MEVSEGHFQILAPESRAIPMDSTPLSAPFQVVTAGPTSDPVERLRRMGQTIGLWGEETDFLRGFRQIFRNFDFRGKTMLELGCGKGILCLWAALKGAQEVVGLEPLIRTKHQTSEDRKDFQAMAEELALPQAKIAYCKVQEYNAPDSTFDLVLSVGSVNLLDEKSCIRLRESPLAVMSYERIFRRVARMMKPGGKLIIMDAAQRNFFGDLSLRNPVAPCTEWFKHQQPEYWSDLLGNCGFGRAKIRWTSGTHLRDLYIPYIPKWVAYFGHSNFRLEMTRVR